MWLKLDESRILWPGRQTIKPEGFMIPTHLKVLTIAEKPFVYIRKADTCLADEIKCPHFNTTETDGKRLGSKCRLPLSGKDLQI